MANRKTTAAATRPAPSDDTTDRIRAFLDSMQRLRGCATHQAYDDGRATVVWIGAQCQGKGSAMPDVDLSAKACADVLRYLGGSEPVNPPTFWDDPPDAASPSCGLQAVLYALECNMRVLAPAAVETASADQAEPENKAETPSISDAQVQISSIHVRLCVLAAAAREVETGHGNVLIEHITTCIEDLIEPCSELHDTLDRIDLANAREVSHG